MRISAAQTKSRPHLQQRNLVASPAVVSSGRYAELQGSHVQQVTGSHQPTLQACSDFLWEMFMLLIVLCRHEKCYGRMLKR